MQSEKKISLQFDAIVAAPFGAIGITVKGMQVAIELLSTTYHPMTSSKKLAADAAGQVTRYMEDAHHDFNLPLLFKGTPMQRRVWERVLAIPVGAVITYAELAKELGSGARVVANACGANSMPLIVPCHRVVASDGLGGFMQGDPRGPAIKAWLLKHEGVDV